MKLWLVVSAQQTVSLLMQGANPGSQLAGFVDSLQENIRTSTNKSG